MNVTESVWRDFSSASPYTFEGKTIRAWRYDRDAPGREHAYACLKELCDVLGCGDPSAVIKSLDVGIAILWTKGSDPGDAMIPLNSADDMATIRSLCPDWSRAVRFREWLVEKVFPDFPGELRFVDWDERRWADERKERTAAMRRAIKLVE